MVWRPFYFGNLIVDPKDENKIFKPDLILLYSTDGGKTFNVVSGGAHGDFHDVWIDPNNTNIVIAGDDGGLWRSEDGGSRWKHQMNLPISQFYHVSTDNADPYHVYGGLAGQQFVGGRFVVSGRHCEFAVGEHVRRRWILDVRRSFGPDLHLRGGAGRNDRAGQPIYA